MWSKKIKLSLGGLIMLVVFVVVASQVQAALLPYELEVSIGSVDSVSGVADYINTLYEFIVGIAGVLATVMIMYGGWQWIFAAGNESAITSAKEHITSAIIGLVLALASYLILFTINPQLVELRNLEPSEIVPNTECTVAEESIVAIGGACEKDCQCQEALKNYDDSSIRASCVENKCKIAKNMPCAWKKVNLDGTLQLNQEDSAVNACPAGKYICGNFKDDSASRNPNVIKLLDSLRNEYGYLLMWSCIPYNDKSADGVYDYQEQSGMEEISSCEYPSLYRGGFNSGCTNYTNLSSWAD